MPHECRCATCGYTMSPRFIATTQQSALDTGSENARCIGEAIANCDRIRLVGRGGTNYYTFEFWIAHPERFVSDDFNEFISTALARLAR